MEIMLYNNKSENRVMGKTITLLNTLNCTLKDDNEILTPEIILTYSEDIKQVNYCYIPTFNRYYFVEITALTGNRYQLRCEVDVLESFKDDIKNLNAIISNTESYGANNYLPSDVWVTNCKHKTDIVNFPNGLLDTGEFILITAGG